MIIFLFFKFKYDTMMKEQISCTSFRSRRIYFICLNVINLTFLNKPIISILLSFCTAVIPCFQAHHSKVIKAVFLFNNRDFLACMVIFFCVMLARQVFRIFGFEIAKEVSLPESLPCFGLRPALKGFSWV